MVIQCNRKLTIQIGWKIQPPFLIKMQNNLHICFGAKQMSFLFQFGAQLLKIINLARLDGCSKVSVYESIAAVRKKYQKLFKDHPNETRFSG